MFFAGPPGHVRADLADQSQGGVRPDGVDLCEVRPGEPVEWAADVEARLVLGPVSPTRHWQRGLGQGLPGGHVLQQGVDRVIAGADLVLVAVVELEVLSQHKDMFAAVVPGEGRGDLLFGGAAARVAMGGQGLRVRHTAGDVADDLHPGEARDVGQHVVELDVHLDQRLLYPSDVRPGALHQRLSVSEVGAQRGDGR